jgi:hypothetical protein
VSGLQSELFNARELLENAKLALDAMPEQPLFNPEESEEFSE